MRCEIHAWKHVELCTLALIYKNGITMHALLATLVCMRKQHSGSQHPMHCKPGVHSLAVPQLYRLHQVIHPRHTCMPMHCSQVLRQNAVPSKPAPAYQTDCNKLQLKRRNWHAYKAHRQVGGSMSLACWSSGAALCSRNTVQLHRLRPGPSVHNARSRCGLWHQMLLYTS